MKDLNGKEIDFADEKLFPSEFMMPKSNRLNLKEITTRYEEKSEDEIAEDMAKFMHTMNAILE